MQIPPYLAYLYYASAIVFYVMSTVAVLASYGSFRRNHRVRRLEWLSNLYRQFFQESNYKRIRRIIDYDTSELKTIDAAIKADCAHELVELMVDYLNFFEFVAGLWKSRELEKKEICILFEYYLSLLKDHSFLMDYIKNSGFENLHELLAEIPVRTKPKSSTQTFYLFVYGTLRKLTSHQTHRLLLPAAFVQQGFFTGKLYDVGAYPGAIRGTDPSEIITGEIYLLHEPEATLEKLDKYEGCSPGDAEPTEYKREVADIQLQTGETVKAWIYIYNHDAKNLGLIESGDYAKHTALQGNS